MHQAMTVLYFPLFNRLHVPNLLMRRKVCNFDENVCSGGGRRELVLRACGGADAAEGSSQRVEVLHRRMEHQQRTLLGREFLLIHSCFFLVFVQFYLDIYLRFLILLFL